jgi:hypothetical protein
MKKTIATWYLSLNCDCPHCDEYIDILDDEQFLLDNRIVPCENGTNNSRNIEVVCSVCFKEFLVDLEY